MKTTTISKIVLSLGLAFGLGSGVTQAYGGSFQDEKLPVITIHSIDNVTRGETGSFVLDMKPALILGGMYVKFSVNGTAVPGVDYIPPLDPAYIGPSGYALIQFKTLPDPRGLPIPQAYSVVVTLEPGAGYAVGEPSKAKMWIKPSP
jgi:hypothetical protein